MKDTDWRGIRRVAPLLPPQEQEMKRQAGDRAEQKPKTAKPDVPEDHDDASPKTRP